MHLSIRTLVGMSYVDCHFFNIGLMCVFEGLRNTTGLGRDIHDVRQQRKQLIYALFPKQCRKRIQFAQFISSYHYLVSCGTMVSRQLQYWKWCLSFRLYIIVLVFSLKKSVHCPGSSSGCISICKLVYSLYLTASYEF